MADASLTARQHQGEESRRRIIEAASTLMAERGYAGTSISAVIERSGLPASSIYWHFESKEGLLAAVIEDGATRWFESLPRWEDLAGPDVERHRELLRATGAALERRPEFLRLLLLIALERGDTDPDSLAVVRRVRERARSGLRAVIGAELQRRRIDDENVAASLARLSLAVADGAFIAHVIDPDETDVGHLFELLADAIAPLVSAALGRSNER